jgi:aryl-alcohol dehydrogenase-like predicted oxidoreductase
VTRNAEKQLLPLCAERGVAVIVNRTFEDGALFRSVRDKKLPAWAEEFDYHSWAQFFLKFVLSHPAVTTVIPTTRKPRHLLDNMQAGIGRLPESKTREKMAAYMREI